MEESYYICAIAGNLAIIGTFIVIFVFQGRQLRALEEGTIHKMEATDKHIEAVQNQVKAIQVGGRGQNLISLINFLQRPADMPKYRGIVRSLEDKDWDKWRDDEKNSAVLVGNTYDIAGLLLKHKAVPETEHISTDTPVKDIILENWGDSIVACDRILHDYRDHIRKKEGRPNYWQGLEWFADEARQYFAKTQSSTGSHGLMQV